MRTKLLAIQTELKAPKNQRNSHGNYNYRSCEDILEAVKPLLKKYDCLITISDDIVSVLDRVYVKSTVTLSTFASDEKISVSAFAREQFGKYNKDGKEIMDHSQITGSTSSYARKYALNGLFLIDDTKDEDATNTHGKDKPEEKPKGDQKAIIEAINKKTTMKELDNVIQKRVDYFWTESELKEQNDNIEKVRSFIMESK